MTHDSMHEVQRWEASDSEAVEALIKIWVANSSKRHIDLLDETRSQIEQVCGNLELPDPFDTCLVQGHSWKPMPDNWDKMTQIGRAREVANGVSTEVGWSFIRRISEPLSDAWFMGEIAMRVDRLAQLPDDQRIDAAVRLGYLIGQWSSRRNLANVTRGKTVRKGASKGGEERSRVLSRGQMATLEAIKTLIDRGHSIRRASEMAHAKGFGTSPEANRKLWSRKGIRKPIS